jgi:Fe-S oxidoreductase
MPGNRKVATGAWIVGIEPSCILTLRDEVPDLVRDARTKALAAASVTLEEFLASLPDYRPGRLERRAIVHGHCHQKALVGMEPPRQVLSKVEDVLVEKQSEKLPVTCGWCTIQIRNTRPDSRKEWFSVHRSGTSRLPGHVCPAGSVLAVNEGN